MCSTLDIRFSTLIFPLEDKPLRPIAMTERKMFMRRQFARKSSFVGVDFLAKATKKLDGACTVLSQSSP